MRLMAEQDMPTQTDRTDLSDLLRLRRAELRLSFEQMERRAVDPQTGRRVPGSWIHRLEQGLTPAPEMWRLRALTRALELPLGKIQDAAASQFFHVDAVWSVSGEARALVEDAERLTPEAREQIRRLIQTLAPRANE
jgi:hypothetical protein